jgi:hypothetical protein
MSELRTISITLGDAPPFSSVVFAGFGSDKSLSFAKFSLSELPDTMGADFVEAIRAFEDRLHAEPTPAG